ncbi:glycosyltransferase [Odoribacter lunatus]|uniref:glycosyltransferase n=1 Tax=Odoribacter lunatus TaxID=2941335 RepID=UPI002041F81A|nr:glycosyltransferase [Odoribacter lunatus]
MDGVTVFWESLGSNRYWLLVCGILFLWHVISVIYSMTVICRKEKNKGKVNNQGVSLIITANNKADYLKQNLEYFLNQKYELFEVIVVDECSEDDTQDVLAEMQTKYPKLRTTRIFPDTKFRSTKKLAINIGILAAHYDIVLFAEINSRPLSDLWIKNMMSYFTEDTAVVLGYANYSEGERNINFHRMYRFLRYLKMLLFVRNRIYVLGEGYNMAYRKGLYLSHKVFARNSQSYAGYDSEIVRILSKSGKVKVAKNKNTFIEINDDRKKTRTEDFTYYSFNRRKWEFQIKLKAHADSLLRFMFYVVSFYLIYVKILQIYMIFGILLMFLIDFIAVNSFLRRFNQKKLFLTSFIVGFIGFLYRWYYNVNSIFTNKKWR